MFANGAVDTGADSRSRTRSSAAAKRIRRERQSELSESTRVSSWSMFVERWLITVAETSDYVVCRLCTMRSRRSSYTRSNRPGAFSSLAMAERKVATGAAVVAAILARGPTSFVAVSTISLKRRDWRTDVERSGGENSGLNGLSPGYSNVGVPISFSFD